MFEILPILLKDGYKTSHKFQYPTDTTMVYSNFTPRKGRGDSTGIIFFGLQYFLQEYLIRQFNENFFSQKKEKVIKQYDRRIRNYLGQIDVSHIKALHDLGYLPLKIKALPEGCFVPYGVPVLTITNTHPDFFWLPNMLESVMSNVLWMASTSATTAFEFKKTFIDYAKKTVGKDMSFVQWQGHDFSFRGMSGVEAAMLSGAGHLTSFTGTDTIPAIDFLEEFYGADSDKELIGGSVPATEHSVMSMGLQENELETFKNLITNIYPNGIVSVVSDTWDLWKVIWEFLPALKSEILARDGKLVIRPDSGDPADIICGDPLSSDLRISKGAIESLWDIFGGTITPQGYKLLDSHIGLIYGDGITHSKQNEILSRLAEKGFASYNVVFGVGSYAYQYVTRDTHGFAMKATAGATRSRGFQEIFKDPITDNGAGKKSARGLLRVTKKNGKLFLKDQVTPVEERNSLLREVFVDGKLFNLQTLAQVRETVNVSSN